MLGREVNMPIDLIFPLPQNHKFPCHIEYVEWVQQAMLENFELVRENSKAAQLRQTQYYDKRTRNKEFSIGNWVLKYYHPKQKVN